MPESKLIIRFPDQSKSYAHGVEFGRLMGKMERKYRLVCQDGFPVRIENRDVLISACNHFGYVPVFGQEYFGEWVDFSATKIDSLS